MELGNIGLNKLREKYEIMKGLSILGLVGAYTGAGIFLYGGGSEIKSLETLVLKFVGLGAGFASCIVSDIVGNRSDKIGDEIYNRTHKN